MSEINSYIFVRFVYGEVTHLLGTHDPYTLCGQHLNRPHTTDAKSEEPVEPVCATCRTIAGMRG